MSWFLPNPNFGYTITAIDDHPWNTLITMREIVRLEPGSIRFTGPNAEKHREFWAASLPELFVEEGKKPVFTVDSTGIHPHRVESEPRTPFKPWKE